MLHKSRNEGGERASRSRRRLSAAFFLLILLCPACGVERSEEDSDPSSEDESSYATRLNIEERSYGHSVRIKKSEEGGEEDSHYRLVEKGKEAKADGGKGKRIQVPVERIACFSSTHIGMLLALEASDRLVAFSRRKYLYDRKLRKKMEEGEIEAIGMQRSLDEERLVALDADILLLDGMASGKNGFEQVLQRSGIAEMGLLAWREEHPLGRAEWIRLFGILTGKQEKADSIFEARTRAYDSIAKIAADVEERPRILANAPHKGTWHVPGGKSYKARLIEDAGGRNPWAEEKSTGGVPKSLEEVIAKGQDADIWIEPGRAKSLEGLKSKDERMERFEAFRNGKVYNNDRRKSEGRGNDFWESGPINPHRILEDLITIFHPGSVEGRELHYYRRLAKEESS